MLVGCTIHPPTPPHHHHHHQAGLAHWACDTERALFRQCLQEAEALTAEAAATAGGKGVGGGGPQAAAVLGEVGEGGSGVGGGWRGGFDSASSHVHSHTFITTTHNP